MEVHRYACVDGETSGIHGSCIVGGTSDDVDGEKRDCDSTGMVGACRNKDSAGVAGMSTTGVVGGAIELPKSMGMPGGMTGNLDRDDHDGRGHADQAVLEDTHKNTQSTTINVGCGEVRQLSNRI